MKRSLSSLQVRSLATTIVEHATRAEAEELIKACNEVIAKRKRDFNTAVQGYAADLLPLLHYVDVINEFGVCGITYVFLDKGGIWNWYDGYATPRTTSINAYALGKEGALPCPEFTLETHTKIMQFIKSYEG